MIRPSMVSVRQRFIDDAIPDLTGAIVQGLRALHLDTHLPTGASVAIAVGSRGVSPIREVVRAIVDELRAIGAHPFVVPAMGSHGGGTAEGQREVLENYGISESLFGVPVRSSMETVVLGTTDAGVPVHIDAYAAKADGIILIGRVKPHTGFRGPVESGLCKMLAVGLGKAAGAKSIHSGGLAIAIPAAAAIGIARAPVLAGIALVENAFDRPCRVEVVAPSRFYDTDHALLAVAREKMPRIPVDEADLLIVDEMGKNVSGTGMDPNIVGMWRRFGGERQPNYARLAVLSLTPQSHGNGTGVGLADFTTQRLVDAIDWRETHLNALTAMDPQICRTPMTLESDRVCIDTALDLLRRSTNREPTVIRIKNTLELEHLYVSSSLVDRLGGDSSVEGESGPMKFDAIGRLT